MIAARQQTTDRLRAFTNRFIAVFPKLVEKCMRNIRLYSV